MKFIRKREEDDDDEEEEEIRDLLNIAFSFSFFPFRR
jgi:hypothetical protein